MEGIEEMKLPDADLIRSRPWNQMKRKDLEIRVWERKMRGRELNR